MTVIFARPRWEYNSYSDLWKLVELAGYPLVFIDEMDTQSDNVYIFSTPDTYWHEGYPNAKARIIYLSLEWYLNVDYANIPCVETWATDKWFADKRGLRYVPMGGDSRLNPQPNYKHESEYIAAFWAASGNRYNSMGSITQTGLKIAPNAWGEERHQLLIRSRLMAHAHQSIETPTVAPQRFALAAAYHLPLVSETLGDAGIFENVVLQTTASDMGDYIMRLNVATERKAGDRLYKLLCEDLTFQKSIEGAL